MRRATYIKYKKDETKWWIFPTIVIVYLVPLVLKDEYVIYTLTTIGVTMIATVGLDLVTGVAGQISVGHSAFMAIGAYTYALLSSSHPGMNVFLILFVAGSVSGIISLSLGFPALRVKGLYLALITMGFCICMDILIIYFEKITGGSTGIPTPNPTILGVKFDTDIKKYYLIYSFVILATIIGRLILDSKIGRAFFGIRDSDIAAETNGVNMILYRNLAFIIGCFYAGVAGALYAINFNYIEPKSFDIEASVYYLVVLIIGGYGNIYGALIGSLTIGWLMDFFKQLQGFVRIKGADELRVILYGLVILIFIVFEPNGCYGRWRVIRAYFKAFPLNETHRKRIAWIRRWK